MITDRIGFHSVLLLLHTVVINKSTRNKTKQNNNNKNKQTKKQSKKKTKKVWAIPNLLSTTKDEICRSNGKIIMTNDQLIGVPSPYFLYRKKNNPVNTIAKLRTEATE